MINTQINFGGFYNSIHDDNIEWAIESYFSDDDGNFNYDDISDKINYSKVRKDYINSYTSLFSTWIKDNYALSIRFKDIELISPKYYNYETDCIKCYISDTENNALMTLFKNDNEFLSYLKENTKSSSGYMSHYSYDEALNNKNDILSVYILEFLSRKFENDDFLSYYDNSAMYDDIYQSLTFS